MVGAKLFPANQNANMSASTGLSKCSIFLQVVYIHIVNILYIFAILIHISLNMIHKKYVNRSSLILIVPRHLADEKPLFKLILTRLLPHAYHVCRLHMVGYNRRELIGIYHVVEMDCP